MRITGLLFIHNTPTHTPLRDEQTAAITGTITGNVIESEIVTGGKTIIITLTGDIWVATIGADNGFTDGLMDGIDSAQSEGTGWDAEVRDKLVFGDVARTSDTVVTITLGAEAAYDITANETITVTIPNDNTEGAVEIVASPTFQVSAEQAAAENAIISGVAGAPTATYGSTGPTIN